MTWLSDIPPPSTRIASQTWPRVVTRLLLLLLTLCIGLLLHLVMRLVERVSRASGRPLTSAMTQAVCRVALLILRLSRQVEGTPARTAAAVVANHSSWLDILVLNSTMRVAFVSKADVASWPGIGFLSRITGTVFIRRDRREAAQHARVLQARLLDGDRLLFFPEGTSSDGLRVLPFKTTLFAALVAPDLRATLSVQPVSVTYTPPEGFDPRALGWWGDMDFGGHFLAVLAMPRAGKVRLVFHPAIPVVELPDRKALAMACESAVRAGFGPPV